MLSRTGDAIRQARSARGISEAELAKDIGISSEFLSAVEAGQKRPTLEILLLIALRLEMPPKQIYGAIGDDPKAARLTEHSDVIMDLYEAAKKIRCDDARWPGTDDDDVEVLHPGRATQRLRMVPRPSMAVTTSSPG